MVVTVEQNLLDPQLTLVDAMLNTVNGVVMWGFALRSVKLSNVNITEKYYGACYKYYVRSLEFETNVDTFDRFVLDEGTKVLNGEWDASDGDWIIKAIAPGVPADATNPQHFNRFYDRKGNPTRVLLNGAGLPANVKAVVGTSTSSSQTGDPGEITIEYYGESNFFQLGIPAALCDRDWETCTIE
jgi:hypothetical protein